jgi:hypothetical protein
MSRFIKVFYDKKGKIIIEDNTTNPKIEVPITDFFNLELKKKDKPPTKFTDHKTNIEKFIQEQQHLRALDCMKDAKIGTNVSSMVYRVCYPDLSPEPFSILSPLKEKFVKFFKNDIKENAWTKISKDSSLQPKIQLNTVFVESGLSSDYFIDSKHFCGNIATEIIDPAKRAALTKNDIVFPDNEVVLDLNQSLLELFGFINCSLRAKRKGNKNYDYVLTIDGVVINDSTTSIPSENVSVNWFQGNKEKNKFLDDPPKKSKLSRETKNAVFMCKEFGDFLQVLLMFIWSKIYNNTYSITTCDEVVMLQCMVMQLNCVVAPGSKEDETGVKVRRIQFFEPNSDTPEKAIARFNDEKNAILEENSEFIEIIKKLQNDPSILLYASGDESIKYTFKVSFYEDIISDLEKINELLKGVKPKKGLSKQKIDDLLEYIKKNFLLLHFIKFSGKDRKLKILISYKKYTSGEDWKTSYEAKLLNYGRKNFYEIGIGYNLVSGGGGSGESGNSYRTPENNIIELGRDITEKEADLFRRIEFEEEAMFYDKDSENEYNLYELLNTQIEDNLKKMGAEAFSMDVKNILYHYFYLNNTVLYDRELTKLIENLLSNELSIQPISNISYISPITKKAFSVISKKSMSSRRSKRPKSSAMNFAVSSYSSLAKTKRKRYSRSSSKNKECKSSASTSNKTKKIRVI